MDSAVPRLPGHSIRGSSLPHDDTGAAQTLGVGAEAQTRCGPRPVCFVSTMALRTRSRPGWRHVTAGLTPLAMVETLEIDLAIELSQSTLVPGAKRGDGSWDPIWPHRP